MKSTRLLLNLFLLPAIIIFLLLTSCNSNHLFRLLSPDATGISFSNDIVETERLNIIQYLYMYNGGGVAIGDVNNDSLPDVYFTANQKSNRLYLNKGNFKFEDVTEKAGVQGLTGEKS